MVCSNVKQVRNASSDNLHVMESLIVEKMKMENLTVQMRKTVEV